MGSGVKFFQSVMGHRFYEGQLPHLIRTLERIAAALEAAAKKPEPFAPVRSPGMTDLMVPPETITKPREEWVCRNCGGDSVEVMMWVSPNTEEIAGDVEPITADTTFCHTCDDHHGVMTRSAYIAEKRK